MRRGARRCVPRRRSVLRQSPESQPAPAADSAASSPHSGGLQRAHTRVGLGEGQHHAGSRCRTEAIVSTGVHQFWPVAPFETLKSSSAVSDDLRSDSALGFETPPEKENIPSPSPISPHRTKNTKKNLQQCRVVEACCIGQMHGGGCRVAPRRWPPGEAAISAKPPWVWCHDTPHPSSLIGCKCGDMMAYLPEQHRAFVEVGRGHPSERTATGRRAHRGPSMPPPRTWATAQLQPLWSSGTSSGCNTTGGAIATSHMQLTS